jgi:hypothetical protein
MKHSFILSALVAGLVSSQALANTVTIKNASKNQNPPITLVYKIAHQNPGQEVIYSAPMVITIKDQEAIHFGLDGFALAGVIPTSINGHQLPPFKFNQPDECTVATDKKNPHASLTFTVDKHHATCATNDGTIDA